MNKFTFLAAAALLLFSCTGELNPEGNTPGGNPPEDKPGTVSVPQGAVDLGLSVFWASCNVCEDGFVKSPEEFGDYYAWGETEPHYAKGHSQDNPCDEWRVIGSGFHKKTMTGYDWRDYKWCNGDSRKLTKYSTNINCGCEDNKVVLESSDDVASEKLGGKWRMPTPEEWSELITMCTTKWVANYNGTGVSGRKITAQNGNSIFLPAAGYRCGTELYSLNGSGCYWTSFTRGGVVPHQAEVGEIGPTWAGSGSDSRCNGFPVRPVTE